MESSLIVVKRKPIEEILRMLEGHDKILVVGCEGGCGGVQQIGGKQDAEEVKKLLETAGKNKVTAASSHRLCDQRLLKVLHGLVDECDVILSLGCGAGVQIPAQLFPNKLVIPGNNTWFDPMYDLSSVAWSSRHELERFFELCRACGECILYDTGGVCPIARCPKHLFNGPCGGYKKEDCELGKNRECTWIIVYHRLKEQGRLDLLRKFRLPKDGRRTEYLPM